MSLSAASATAQAVQSNAPVPDAAGHFGAYGGVFVPETLIFALQQLEGRVERLPAPGGRAVPTGLSASGGRAGWGPGDGAGLGKAMTDSCRTLVGAGR